MRSGKFEQRSGNKRRIHIIPIVVAAAALALGCYFVSHFRNRQTLTQVSDIAPEEAPTVQTQVSQEYRETEEATVTVEADPYEPYYKSYQSYIDWRLGFGVSPQNQYYSFYDINGDGIPELFPGGRISLYEILSLKNGESYKYADLTYLRAGFLCFEICEDQVLKLKDYDSETWFFLKAHKDDMTFLQGLRKENGDWYLLIEPPAAANADWTRKKIADTEAQQIMNTYVPLEAQPDRQPMTQYGHPVTYPWKDPYALYIAQSMDQSENAADFTYALMDLNGDGTQELITKDVYTLPPGAAEPVFELSIHTIVDGKIASVPMFGTSISNVCENGILMYSDPNGAFYEFYRLDGTELRLVEKASGDRAAEIANTYKIIQLDMKPFSEYPFS